MAVYIVNLVIDQGADFTQTFNLEDDASASALDLTGYTGAAQLRKHSSSNKKFDFTVAFPDRENGIVRIDMTDTITSSICLLYTSPSPRDPKTSRMPSSA